MTPSMGNTKVFRSKPLAHAGTYVYMACMSDNYEGPSGYFGDSSKLINWIFDTGATCHMIPEV